MNATTGQQMSGPNAVLLHSRSPEGEAHEKNNSRIFPEGGNAVGHVLNINTEKLGKTHKTTSFGHWTIASRGEWCRLGPSRDKIAVSLALYS